jgi:CBS domain-containing protein
LTLIVEVNLLSSDYREELENVLEYPVRVNMIKMLLTASILDSITDLIYQMIEKNIGAAIVVEGDEPVGILTQKDVLEKVVRPRKNLDQTLAGDIMSKPLIKIEFDRPIREALELMHKHNIRRLAVMKNKDLVGLVTERGMLEVISARAGKHVLV